MRRWLPAVLIGIGAFLVVAGLLARFYAYPALAVAPIDQNGVTRLQAVDATILDTATLSEITTDLAIVNRTVGDVAASEDAGGGTVVWAGTTSIRDDEGNIRSRSAERYAFDAHTGIAVNCCGGFIETTDGEREEVKRSGLLSKYPFATEKKDYQVWDSTLEDTVTAQYVKEDTIDGLAVYEFRIEVPATTVGTREIPGSLVGQDDVASIDADIQYAVTTTQWVEPVTGAIVDRSSETANTLAIDGETAVTTTAGTIEYTDAQVKANVEDFSSNASLLSLVKTTVPIVGIVLGLLLIAGGLLLTRMWSGAGGGRSSAGARG